MSPSNHCLRALTGTTHRHSTTTKRPSTQSIIDPAPSPADTAHCHNTDFNAHFHTHTHTYAAVLWLELCFQETQNTIKLTPCDVRTRSVARPSRMYTATLAIPACHSPATAQQIVQEYKYTCTHTHKKAAPANASPGLLTHPHHTLLPYTQC